MRQSRLHVAASIPLVLLGAPAALADAVSYSFAFTGASGSIGQASFTDATVSFTLLADTNDVMPGSPRGFHVTPTFGFVTLADGTEVAITPSAVANSAVWTYTTEAQGLRIGYGSWVPFADFTSGSYAGPLGWSMASSFTASAVGTESILRQLGPGGSGISTSLGTFTIASYGATSFAAIVVPAPAALAVAAAGAAAAAGTRRRR
jgi:hypothetical protein